MRAVLQRVSSAQVSIDGVVRAKIGPGLLVLLGVAPGDNDSAADWLAQKIAKLRIFPDEAGLMNRSLSDLQGEVLVISQFTLFASTRKGTRPSYHDAAPPDLAAPLYELFVARLRLALGGLPIATGEFGAMMQVSLTNDGPVTLIIDTQLRE